MRTTDELNLEARSACRYPTGHPEDRGPAYLRLSAYGWVVETPYGVFEVRDEQDRTFPRNNSLVGYVISVERAERERARLTAEEALR